MPHFILVASDKENKAGSITAAHEVALSRLNRGTWGLYEKTPNRLTISKGDRVLVYASGSKKHSLSFIGMATIERALTSNHRNLEADPDFLSEPIKTLIFFSDVSIFTPPIDIRNLRQHLSFVPKHNKWGVCLIGGCKSISKEDFNRIVSSGGTRI